MANHIDVYPTRSPGDIAHIADHNALQVAVASLSDRLTVPAGGAAGTLLKKNSTADGDLAWQDASVFASSTDTRFMTAAERTKLGTVAQNATANSSDASLLNRANHTGTQSADTVVDGTNNKAYTTAEKAKLATVAQNATSNSADSALVNRANHTGTQSADTIVTGVTNAAYSLAEQAKFQALVNQVRAEVVWDGTSAITRTGTQKLDIISATDPAASVTGGVLDGDRWLCLS